MLAALRAEGKAGMEPRYFNREVSWLEFNLRVLEEAMDTSHPLLERVKFLAIYHSNLDEFYMIRVSGLQEQVESGLVEPTRDGLTPVQQLEAIRKRTAELNALACSVFRDDLLPKLAEAGICICEYKDLTASQRRYLDDYYRSTVYPVLTPLAVDPGHPFPHISNLSLSLAVSLRHPKGSERFARVKIPQVLPRLVPVPPATRAGKPAYRHTFVWLEQLVAHHLESLFTGMQVLRSYAFRVTRDADIEIREDEAGDLLQAIQATIGRRRFGAVTRLEVASSMPPEIRQVLAENLVIHEDQISELEAPLGLSEMMCLMAVDAPELKDPPFQPRIPKSLREPDIFAAIRRKDILLHHPYDSFEPVIAFVEQAARDPDVLAIKQTIYRVGSNSPIVNALAEASSNGKQVSVMVELKARFDEENNIEWARALERAGAHVVYGDINLKTHCKVLLVVRREPDGIRRYVHLSTGNYNAKTALIYTDLGLFTCDPDIAEDVTALFNSLTGYSLDTPYRKLLVAPGGIRNGLNERIDREIAHARAGRPARLVFKVNTISDFPSVDRLYEASCAGVDVDLIVRGSSCLVPGVPGLSDRIRVVSIVGRFLEHHRVYYFLNAGMEEVWLGSADLMRRNLDHRIETLFPVQNECHKRWFVDHFLPAFLRDNQKARVLRADGTYARVRPAEGEEPFSAQAWFLSSLPGAITAEAGRPKSSLRAG